MLNKSLLVNAINWFILQFHETLVHPIGSQFPNHPFPREIETILRRTAEILQQIQGWQEPPMLLAQVGENLSQGDLNQLRLFKQIIYRSRRWRAAYTEGLIDKTFHLELTGTLEQDIKVLDSMVNEEWFQKIETLRLPRLKDYLPVQFIEAAEINQNPLLPRQHDQKFHILQAPNLFLPDLTYFRAKCEDRETPLAIAFLDIDHFKPFNTDHTETKVDRDLLPRFMQTVEAHVFHHGYAYRQGGDEFLVLIPSLSRQLSIAFLEELRFKLAELKYPDIPGQTTVSIGLCIVESDCPLTDRELRDRANQAKEFAKKEGRNCIATYEGSRFVAQELQIVRPQAS